MQFEVEAGQGDVLLMWGEKLADSIAEAQLIDNYKMQVNIDSDGEGDGPVSQKEASVIKEGFMRKKKASHGVMEDLKRHWERRYCVLYNDGKLRFYESRQKKDEGSLDLRFFALEVEEELDIEEEEGGEKQALKVADQFFKIERETLGLFSDKYAFPRLARACSGRGGTGTCRRRWPSCTRNRHLLPGRAADLADGRHVLHDAHG